MGAARCPHPPCHPPEPLGGLLLFWGGESPPALPRKQLSAEASPPARPRGGKTPGIWVLPHNSCQRYPEAACPLRTVACGHPGDATTHRCQRAIPVSAEPPVPPRLSQGCQKKRDLWEIRPLDQPPEGGIRRGPGFPLPGQQDIPVPGGEQGTAGADPGRVAIRKRASEQLGWGSWCLQSLLSASKQTSPAPAFALGAGGLLSNSAVGAGTANFAPHMQLLGVPGLSVGLTCFCHPWVCCHPAAHTRGEGDMGVRSSAEGIRAVCGGSASNHGVMAEPWGTSHAWMGLGGLSPPPWTSELPSHAGALAPAAWVSPRLHFPGVVKRRLLVAVTLVRLPKKYFPAVICHLFMQGKKKCTRRAGAGGRPAVQGSGRRRNLGNPSPIPGSALSLCNHPFGAAACSGGAGGAMAGSGGSLARPPSLPSPPGSWESLRRLIHAGGSRRGGRRRFLRLYPGLGNTWDGAALGSRGWTQGEQSSREGYRERREDGPWVVFPKLFILAVP